VKGPAVTCVVSGTEQTDGRTPLHIASKFGHIDVVRALLAAGAAVNQTMVRCRWRRGHVVLSGGLCVCVCVCVCLFVCAHECQYGASRVRDKVCGDAAVVIQHRMIR
jgi:hypothetical protein